MKSDTPDQQDAERPLEGDFRTCLWWGLIEILDETGRYIRVDVTRDLIRWCITLMRSTNSTIRSALGQLRRSAWLVDNEVADRITIRNFQRCMGLEPGMTVFEVGCGIGEMLCRERLVRVKEKVT